MINIQNIDDNECYEWCIVGYLNPLDHHPVRITKADNNFSKRLTFKGIKVPAKTRDIHKKEKKSHRHECFGYQNKEKNPSYVPKESCEEKHVDLSLTGEDGKINYVPIKYFNTFMYNHTLNCGRKNFCR